MLIRLLARFFASFSPAAQMRIGRALGAFWFHVIRVRRRVAEQAVARAFPERSPADVRRIVKGNFQHLMTSGVETFAYVAYSEARLRELVRYEGQEESVLRHRAAGRGVVAISAHIGNFEMCTDGFGIVFHTPMLMVARLPKGGFARAMLEAFRAKGGMMEVFEPKGASPKVVEALRTRQAVLAFVIDQNIPRGRGIFLPFLGEIANTTTGFASLQRKAGAALCVVQMYRNPDGTHVCHVEPVPPCDHPNLRVAMIRDTLTMAKFIERYVRERPEQWFWVHRRWKSRPEPGDLVIRDEGLERHGKGRLAAFVPEALAGTPRGAEAVRRLETAGVVVERLAEATPLAARAIAPEKRLDLESALFFGAGDPVEAADRWLERVVGGAEA